MGFRAAASVAVFFGPAIIVSAALAAAGGPVIEPDDRGRILYDTYCVQCHTQQVHWRDRRLASDWTRLKQEVIRWQGIVGQRWDDADVTSVARYLNARFYHYPEHAGPMPTVSSAPAR